MNNNVAVIVPVYNTQDYLHRCVSSILEQTGVNLQCILVDDGSTDSSPDIARYYQRKDPRVISVSKNNEGQGPARNIGIQIADAEYLYFVDSDDFLGGNTLKILYDTARQMKLDLCAPKIPDHYFAKPLEAVACLPTKAQFLRTEIVRKFDIRQPAARSGQDGVFSHLFLTHATRIGMARNALYQYTADRAGSTFQTYLKRPDAVASLLKTHYAAIAAHYDAWDLWERNANRIMEFISEESIKNRILPHYRMMQKPDLQESLLRLSTMANKVVPYLRKEHLADLSPLQKRVLEGDDIAIIAAFEDAKTCAVKRKFAGEGRLAEGDVVVCKIHDAALAPLDPKAKRGEAGNDVQDLRKIEKALGQLAGKLDFSINTTLNAMAHNRASALQLATGQRGFRDIDAVVSLTTLPKRLPVLPFVLDSIIGQNLAPTRIVVWMAQGQGIEAEAHRALRSYEDRGVELRFVEDVGPHTKLIYALQAFPDKPVITLDDDMLYPSNTLQYLWEQHLRHPGAIVANWARELRFDDAGKVLGVRSGRLLTPPLLEHKIEQNVQFEPTPNLLVFPYGTCGVLYPPQALDDRFCDVDLFKNLCPREDDIWFKAMAILKGTPGVVTNLGINPPHYSVLGSQIEALRYFNHGEQQNLRQIRAVFDHFDLYQHLAEEITAGRQA